MSPPFPRRTPRDPLDPGWEPLYQAVGIGMWTFAASRFRFVALGGERLRWGPGTLVAATHRQETDVPLAITAIYVRAPLWAPGVTRLHFAARDDLFHPGFFAGFPPRLPPAVRRALSGLSIARGLRLVRVHPIGSATTARVGWLLAQMPHRTPLEDLLPDDLRAELRARAAERGVPGPGTAGEALDGRLADVLWRSFEAPDLDAPALQPAWRRRAASATADLRALVAQVQAGHPILLFPEGRPSPEGDIGPVRRGVGAIVRRGRPRLVQPLAIAYDPLTRGRPRALVAVGPAITSPEEGDPEERVLAALRAAMPLTCAQVLAVALRGAAEAGARRVRLLSLEEAVVRAVAAADEEGRDVDPALRGREARRARLTEALLALAARGLVAPARGAAELRPDAVRGSAALARLAREHDSARAPAGVA